MRKQVANTGQLNRRLYHIPISFVRDEADGLEASIGDKTIGSRDKRRRESKLIRLQVSRILLYSGREAGGERTLISEPESSIHGHYESVFVS